MEIDDAFLKFAYERADERRRLAGLIDAARDGATVGQRLDALREVWRIVEPRVMKTLRERGRCDPYYVDWVPTFTPIERDAWGYIRGLGLPYLPQLPVGPYVVDFGDPIARIAIECDGKRWHGLARDVPRDEKLGELGWMVFRLSGRLLRDSEVNAGDLREEYWNDDYRLARELDDWAINTAAGFFHSLHAAFYGGNLECSVNAAHQSLATKCLVPNICFPRLADAFGSE